MVTDARAPPATAQSVEILSIESHSAGGAVAMAHPPESRAPSSPSESSSCSSSSSSFSPEPSPLPSSSKRPAPAIPTNTRPSSTKLILFAVFTLGAFVAWSLGAWETATVRVGYRPRLRPLLLFVGDSLTERGSIPSSLGWLSMLESDYRRSVDILSRGLSGYNTKWYLKHAMPVIHDEITSGNYMPALVTIWLGANDAALPDGSMSEQHVPIASYQNNLAKLVQSFMAIAPAASILLVTPPHVDDDVQKTNAMDEEGAKKGLVSRSNKVTGQYARACVETASELNVPVLDLYSYFNAMSKSERNAMLVDGLHFNETGNGEVYRQLRDKIGSSFPELRLKLERWQLPPFEDWAETDPWTPEESTTVDFTNVSAVASTGSRASSSWTTRQRPKILLIGDSLTQEGTDPELGGWVCQLQHRYTRSADVVVRGLYGYSTEIFVRHALPGLKRDLASWSEPPAVVTLWLGGNDSALPTGFEAALHVPIAKYRANLREIVQAIRAEAPNTAILMVTPPAVNDSARREVYSNEELDFSNEAVGEYARACVAEAEAAGVSALDFHTLMNDLGEQERHACQYDGLHFNMKGHALVADAILAAIEKEFPTVAKQLDAWEHADYLELIDKKEGQ